MAGPWPQFRGPAGLGVSTENNLPVTWSETSPNVRWQTAIPGDGASSPIVSNGKVFLSTAYEGAAGSLWRRFVRGASLVVVGLMLVVGVKGLITRRAATRDPTKGMLFANWLDRFVVGFAFLFFCVMATLAILGPEAINTLHMQIRAIRPLVKVLWKLGLAGGRHILWIEGEPAKIWLVSGGIFMFGLAAAVGWFRQGSFARIIGAVLVAICVKPMFDLALPFVHESGLAHEANQIAVGDTLYFCIPALLLCSWYVVNYLRVTFLHRRPAGKGGMTADSKSVASFLRAGLTVVVALLVFIPPNFLQPEIGLLRVAVCLDLKSGDLEWENPVLTAPLERKHAENTYASPTPCADGKHVVFNFGSAVVCLDFDGKEVWRYEDPDYTKDSRYGAAVSPVLFEDTVIIVRGRETLGPRPTLIVALDMATGEPRWETINEHIEDTYSTPVLVTAGDRTALILNSFRRITAFDARTGAEIWTEEVKIEQHVAGMASDGNLLCVGGGTAGPKQTAVFRLNPSEADPVEVVWDTNRQAPGCSSPVIHDGLLYTVTDSGIMVCWDAMTGKSQWKVRLESVLGAGGYYASILAADGKIYLSNTAGRTTVFEAGRKKKELAQNVLGDGLYGTPAVADGCLLIRSGGKLFCIAKEQS